MKRYLKEDMEVTGDFTIKKRIIMPVIDTGYTIYVETTGNTGNDTTGDGTSSAPYATIKRAFQDLQNKIISDCKVIIKLGPGTFEMDPDTRIYSSGIYFVGTGNIDISGTTVNQGQLTLTETSSGVYSASTPSEDYYYNYKINKGGAITQYPIGKHSVNEIHFAQVGGSGTFDIDELQTTLIGKAVDTQTNSLILPFGNLGEAAINRNNGMITYVDIILEAEDCFGISSNDLFIQFYMCIIKPTSDYDTVGGTNAFFSIDEPNRTVAFTCCYIDISGSTDIDRVFYNREPLRSLRSRFHGTSIQNYIDLWGNDVCDFTGTNLIDGFDRVVYAYNNPRIMCSGKDIILNCNCVFDLASGEIVARTPYPPSFYLNNVDYYLKVRNGVQTICHIDTSYITGTPTLGWLDPASTNVGYYNPDDGLDLKIPDIYREVDFIDDTTLADNDTTYTVIGHTGQTRSVHLMYTILRNTSYQEGLLKVLYDGSGVFVTDDSHDNGVSSGITFSGDTNGSEIRLTSTLTSTGSNATLKADVKRIMI